METLRAFIQARTTIDEPTLGEVCRHFASLQLPKDRYLLRQGQLVQSYYFVVSGLIRIFYKEEEKEFTGWVVPENTFFTDLGSLRSQQPTRYYMQAAQDCTLYYIDHQAMEQLYKKHPVMQEFGRKVWEDAFIGVLQGVLSYQSKDAGERYETLFQHGELLQQMPLKHLASFIGVTPTSFSRLRRTNKKRD